MKRSTALAAVLAAGALAASPADARPIDRVDRFDPGQSGVAEPPAPHQDLRGERAKDPGPPEIQPGQPTWPIDPQPLSRPEPAAPADDGGGDDTVWVVLGAGLAAAGLIGASVAGAARRYRVRARRVAA